MGAAEDRSKQHRARTITASTTAALAALLEPIIMRAVAEADPDPIIEITREQWPLRRILEAVRRGELGGISRMGRRYFARRSVVYQFVETHRIRVKHRPEKAEAPPPVPETPAPETPVTDMDRMLADLYSRGRRK